MLTRRGLSACWLCGAAVGGLFATPAAAQPVGQPQSAGGVTRTVLQRTNHDDRYVALLVLAEVPADTVVQRHTHPGIESAYVLEGGFEAFEIQGQAEVVPPKAGGSIQVPANTPHAGRTGARPTKLVITYVVEKDKPLASPA